MKYKILGKEELKSKRASFFTSLFYFLKNQRGAFSASITEAVDAIGTLKFVYGTATNAAADTGGDITTGLGAVFAFSLIPTSHVYSTMPKYSVSGGTVTIVCDRNLDFNWMAIGRG